MALGLASGAAMGAERFSGVGRPALPAEIAAWDIDVRPDFKGLPPGSGSVSQGQAVWEAKCASCHGYFGESTEIFPPLVGGTTVEDIRTGRVKALTRPDMGRTTLMKLPTVSTLWDYVNRAMPWNEPKSLSTNDVYAVVAYMLHLGGILPADYVLTEKTIQAAQDRLPNRLGMTRSHGLGEVKGKPDVVNTACMRDCPVSSSVTSFLPDHAKGQHGNLQEQMRPAVKAASPAATTVAAVPMPELARRKACLACHQLDKPLVGPALRDIAGKYRGQPGAKEALVAKVRKGSSGTWGPIAMPPNPDLAESDARSLVQWILDGAV